MKIVRLVLTILAVCAAGYLAFRGCRGTAVAPPAGDGPSKAAGGTTEFPTLLGEGTPVKPPDPAARAAAPTLQEDPPKGEPPPAGAEVPVVVPYRTGTKSRYRIAEAQKSKDRGTDAYMWWQWIWNVSTEVTSGDGSGAARIQLTVNSFRFQTELAGRGVEFDSAKPDDGLLAEEGMNRSLRPAMAILAMPLEFTLDATGRITNVEGADAMNRRFIDAVDAIAAKYVADATDAPTVDSLVERWRELLFPETGGGTMKGGEARPSYFRTTYFERWAARSDGALRVTHVTPDTFRIAFVGKPELEERQVEPKAPSSRAIGKVRVISSADAYTNSWTFDRAKGRLVSAWLSAQYQVHVSRPLGLDANGQPDYQRSFNEIERLVRIELLGE